MESVKDFARRGVRLQRLYGSGHDFGQGTVERTEEERASGNDALKPAGAVHDI